MTRIVRAFGAALALCLALASPSSADLLLLDVGGLGLLGVPTSITISSQVWKSISDIQTLGGGATNYVLTDTWTADVAFSGLGSYGATGVTPGTYGNGSGIAQTCNYTTGLCTAQAFSTGGSTPQWTSQTAFSQYSALATIPVTRPGYTSSATITSVVDPVHITSFLRQTAPNPVPTIGLVNGNPVAVTVLDKAVYQNDILGSASVPANFYYDGVNNSAQGVSVPVSNSSTGAYPLSIGNWITERGITYDGTGNAVIEFIGGNAYARNAVPLAAVNITMADSVGNAVTQTATLKQSDRFPHTGCTATAGSNVLTNCSDVSWAIVGQRVTVASTQNATATATGSIAPGATTFGVTGASSAPVAGQNVFSASAMAQIGTVQSYSGGTVTLTVGGALNASAGASDALVFSGGAVHGEPVVGAIDTTATANCSAGQIPCVELYVQQNATFNTDGSLTINMASAAPGGGPLSGIYAIADGAFLGGTITEVGAGGLWSVATHKIVAPYGVSSDSTHGAGSTTTLPTPVQGQWLTGMYVYDSASTPCVKTDVYSAVSSYIAATGSPATLGPSGAVLSTCNGHTLSGLGIAASPGWTTGTAKTTIVSISTNATSATAGSDTIQINHNFYGATGGVTLTAGNPVPVYQATFSPSAFSGLTAGEIYFRAVGYPQIGDQLIDSDSPTTTGANIAATALWSAGASAITVKNCAGVNFNEANSSGAAAGRQLAVEVVDTTTGLNIGIATQCIGTTLYLASPYASSAGSAGDLLAVGSNIECEYWFPNKGPTLGFAATGAANGVVSSCIPTNAGWLGHGLANAEKLSANFHNLWAYYDKAATQSYAPRYIWLNSAGTCTTSVCVQTGQSDPASNANYVANLTTAVTVAKSYNNSASRASAHNDINGIVFCLMPTGSPWSMAVMTGTTLTPLPTLTSANGTCPAPGKTAPIVATISDPPAITSNINQLRVQNLKIAQAGASYYTFRGTDGPTSYQWGTSFLILDHVWIKPGTSAAATFNLISQIYSYNVLDDDSVYRSSFASSSSTNNAMTGASTIACGGSSTATASSAITTGATATFTITTTTLAGAAPQAGDGVYDSTSGTQLGAVVSYAAGTVTANITVADAAATGHTIVFAGYKVNSTSNASNLYGNVTWQCIVSPSYTLIGSTSPWPNSQIWAYNKFMGILGVSGPFVTQVQAQNTLLTHNIFEAVNSHTTSNHECLELGGDSFDAPLVNVVTQNSTCVGGRTNMNYIEGFATVPAYVASAGLLPVGTYYAQAAFSRVTNPNVVSSTDTYVSNLGNAWAPFQGTVGAANGAWRFSPPCDFNELLTVYLDTPSGMQAAGVVANLTVSGGSGTTMTLSAAPSCPAGGCGGVFPGGVNPSLTVGTASAPASFISSDGVTLLLDTLGKPLYVTACPGGNCSASGNYTLSGTPASALSAGTYYSVNGQLTHLADTGVFSTGVSSGTTLTLGSAPTGFLYVGATLATSSAVITTSALNPVSIASCPSAGCGASGAYTLTGTPATPLTNGTTYVAQATGLNMCQTITVVAVDGVAAANEPFSWLPAPIANATFPSRNYFKAPWVERANIWNDMNMKADYWSELVNGGRTGNWPRRHGVDVSDDVYITAPYLIPCFDYASLCGEIPPANTWYSTAPQGVIYGDMSAVRYVAMGDYSCGGCDQGSPATQTYPALNSGMGAYATTTSTLVPTTTATTANGARMAGTGAAPRVPAGDAQWPFDIGGNPHFANLPGWAGAYELGGQ